MSSGLRREIVDDVGSPRALDESLAVDDAVEDAVRVIRDLVVALGEADRRVDDGGAGGPGVVGDPLRVVQHVGRRHHVLDGAVEGTSVRCEVVLELDQDDGGGLRIGWHGFLLRSGNPA